MVGQHHAPFALTPGERPIPIVQEEAELILVPVWTRAENLALAGILSPDRLSRSKSLYRLRLSPFTIFLYYIFSFSCFSFSYYSSHILSYSDPFFVHILISSSCGFVVPSLFTIGCSGTSSKRGIGKIQAARNPMRIKETGLFLDYLKTSQLHSTCSGGWLLTRLWKKVVVNCVSVLCCSVGKTLGKKRVHPSARHRLKNARDI